MQKTEHWQFTHKGELYDTLQSKENEQRFYVIHEGKRVGAFDIYYQDGKKCSDFTWLRGNHCEFSDARFHVGLSESEGIETVLLAFESYLIREY